MSSNLPTDAGYEDPEFAGTIQWCGDCFDPEWFELCIVAKNARNALRSNAKGACFNRRLKPPRRNDGARSKVRLLSGIEQSFT
ncbi:MULTISPECIES: hypothetical protein [Rhizobium/Agrobacterium group]|uniref:hypothetical protein n=1 Tax=Rhizobium/Agrobacterium group TaxID=227290 RepID=UPI00117BD44F|nr:MULTISPECIES: hypothetical protein [Rhizobium/Agrobacterium group]MDH7808622.1 hypothetical protein [Rhizobium sp. AN67]MDQ4408875.1 hypothetical protein [Rhizobium sp. AN63]